MSFPFLVPDVYRAATFARYWPFGSVTAAVVPLVLGHREMVRALGQFETKPSRYRVGLNQPQWQALAKGISFSALFTDQLVVRLIVPEIFGPKR